MGDFDGKLRPHLEAALKPGEALEGGLKLMLMRAEGGGLMAKLGGGEGQRAGVEALAAWFSRAEGT